MSSIDVLMINVEPTDGRELIKIVEDGSGYFPTETWDDIECIANLHLNHDITIMTGSESFGAFLFERLTKRIRGIKRSNRPRNLLLGITPDPVVAVHHHFDGGRFKRTLHIVHDYVDEKTGVVSLFKISEHSSSKVVAHGLGHNRGLRHHQEPIDLMYFGLLRAPVLQVEGFCRVCLRMLKEEKHDTG